MEFNEGNEGNWAGDLFGQPNKGRIPANPKIQGGTRIPDSFTNKKPITPALITKITLENKSIQDILNYLSTLKIKKIKKLNEGIFSIIPEFEEMLTKDDVSYDEIEKIKTYIKQKFSKNSQKTYSTYLADILFIKNMEKLLILYGPTRFLTYINDKIDVFLEKLNNWNKTTISFKEVYILTNWIEEVKQIEDQNERINFFFTNFNINLILGKSPKSLLTGTLANYPKKYLFFEKQLIDEILKLINKQKESKIEYLRDNLEGFGKTVILVSDKQQIEIIKNELINLQLEDEIIITTPGEFKKNRIKSETLILFDGEMYTDEYIEYETDFKKIIELQFNIL